MAAIKKGQKVKGISSSGRGRGRGRGRGQSKGRNSAGNRSANSSSSRSGLRSSRDDSEEEEEEASDEDSEEEKSTRKGAGRRSGAGKRPGVVSLKGAAGKKTKKYESDDEFVPATRAGKEPAKRMSRVKNKSAGSGTSDEDDDDEEEKPKSPQSKKSSDHKDSDAENNPAKSKPAPSKRAESSVDAPEYVTTPSSSSTPSKGRLADDFDYGDGSLEDMQRLMKLYQKDVGSSSTASASGVSKGRVSQSILSSTVNDFDDDSPPKKYTLPKRGRPVTVASRTESPSSPHSEADDVPDPATEWLKSFRLGCKECDVEEFSSDNLFIQHHLETHRDDRPYKCQNLEKDHVTPKANPDCSSSFRQRHHYKEHIRGVHNPEIKHFKCKQCPKRYSTRSGLTNHSANHSSFKCPTCDLGFNKETTLQKHMIDFNHFGNVADRSSFNEEELRQSLEEMAKSLGAGSSLPPFPTNIHAAGSGPSSSTFPNRSSTTASSASRASLSSRGTTSSGRQFARPFGQRNADGPNKPFARSMAPGGRPFQRPFAAPNRPTPFGRPFPKPFQRPVPTPATDLDREIEEVVLD